MNIKEDVMKFLLKLTIVLVVLKLINFVYWSWIWVFIPLWGPVLIYVLGVLVNLIYLHLRDEINRYHIMNK